MQENIFVSKAMNDAMQLYNSSKDNHESLNYNRFLCVVIRMLILIYGNEIIDAYNSKNIIVWENLILKYGFEKKDYDNFIIVLDKFYNFDIRQQKKSIKKKNKYFDVVQKYLIDMMVKRRNVELIDNDIIKEFYELLFTANSKDFYRKSTAVLLAYDPYEIDEYAKRQNIVVG